MGRELKNDFKNLTANQCMYITKEYVNYGNSGSSEQNFLINVANDIARPIFKELLKGSIRCFLKESISSDIDLTREENVDLAMRAVQAFMDEEQKCTRLQGDELFECAKSIFRIGAVAYRDDRVYNINRMYNLDFYRRDIYDGTMTYLAENAIKYGNTQSKETLKMVMLLILLNVDFPDGLLYDSGVVMYKVTKDLLHLD